MQTALHASFRTSTAKLIEPLSVGHRIARRGTNKFVDLQEVGLINEQINSETRFFVPSDETSAIDVLESLLERYPVMLTEGDVSDGGSGTVEIALQAGVRATEIIDLDEWFVSVPKANPEDQAAYESGRQVDVAEPEAAPEEQPPLKLTQEAAGSWTQLTQRKQTQLAFTFG